MRNPTTEDKMEHEKTEAEKLQAVRDAMAIPADKPMTLEDELEMETDPSLKQMAEEISRERKDK
jgi:hypothetical protein